jgi:hypothetical protein
MTCSIAMSFALTDVLAQFANGRIISRPFDRLELERENEDA